MRTACIIFSILGLVDSFIRLMTNISDIWDYVAKSEYQEQEEVQAFMTVHEYLEVDITEADVRRMDEACVHVSRRLKRLRACA